MSLLQYINEENKQRLNKPLDTDQIYYSELNEWFTTNAFRSLSLKLVLDGEIFYKVDNKEYKVSKNQFMVATKQPDVQAYFNSNRITRSVCIDICEETLNDAYTVLKNERHNEIAEFSPEYLKHPFHSENIYELNQNQLGAKLMHLREIFEHTFPSRDSLNVNREWFLEMVELMVLSEFKNYKLLNSLNALKTSTKQEILKRVISGKEFIDTNYLINPDVKTIARESNMSEFHFYRCFKQVFSISPYQYMLSKRLDHAGVLLDQHELLVSEIASECGFPDVFTFSKAFKRKFGVSPTKTKQVKNP